MTVRAILLRVVVLFSKVSKHKRKPEGDCAGWIEIAACDRRSKIAAIHARIDIADSIDSGSCHVMTCTDCRNCHYGQPVRGPMLHGQFPRVQLFAVEPIGHVSMRRKIESGTREERRPAGIDSVNAALYNGSQPVKDLEHGR